MKTLNAPRSGIKCHDQDRERDKITEERPRPDGCFTSALFIKSSFMSIFMKRLQKSVVTITIPLERDILGNS